MNNIINEASKYIKNIIVSSIFGEMEWDDELETYCTLWNGINQDLPITICCHNIDVIVVAEKEIEWIKRECLNYYIQKDIKGIGEIDKVDIRFESIFFNVNCFNVAFMIKSKGDVIEATLSYSNHNIYGHGYHGTHYSIKDQIERKLITF